MSDSEQRLLTESALAELERLVDRWSDVAEDCRDGEMGYNDGMAEGARSAALELERTIDRLTEGDDV